MRFINAFRAVGPLFLVFLCSSAYSQDRGLQVAASAVVGSADFKVGKQYAAIIGIDRYQQWPALRNAVSDAKEIKKALSDRYYIDGFFELYDQDATAGNIRRLFSTTLPQSLGINDSLLVFYSGHGFLDNSRTGFWIASDGVTDVDDQKGWIPNAQIRNYIVQLKAQRILVISDSCFSGDFLDVSRGAMPAIDSAYYQKALKRTARQVLTSGASEAVPDSSEFARQLLSVLERNDGFILDPYTMYEKLRLGVSRTSPLLGTLPGNEQGACFALFLRNPGSMPSAPGPAAVPLVLGPLPDRINQGGSSTGGMENPKDKISFMMFEKYYLDTAKRQEIRDFSSLLNEGEKKELYKKYGYGAFWPAVGNTFYGLGSWLQGDVLGGIVVSGSMVGGLVLMGTGSSGSGGGVSAQSNAGTALMVGGMLFGWIRPALFASGRNAKIREALQYY
jgi:hypothetical protein